MLRLLVPAQVHFPLESSSAEVARERLEPRVLPAVGYQVGRLTERLPADLAFVRFLPWNGEKKKKRAITVPGNDRSQPQ